MPFFCGGLSRGRWVWLLTFRVRISHLHKCFNGPVWLLARTRTEQASLTSATVLSELFSFSFYFLVLRSAHLSWAGSSSERFGFCFSWFTQHSFLMSMSFKQAGLVFGLYAERLSSHQQIYTVQFDHSSRSLKRASLVAGFSEWYPGVKEADLVAGFFNAFFQRVSSTCFFI